MRAQVRKVEYKTLIGKSKTICCTWTNKREALAQYKACEVPLYKVVTVVTTKRV